MTESPVTAAKKGTQFETEGQKYTVGPKCTENDGRWYCLTHDTSFPNQLQKDVHISWGEHVLTWFCFEHGPEVP